jgi:hypothetical protein
MEDGAGQRVEAAFKLPSSSCNRRNQGQAWPLLRYGSWQWTERCIDSNLGKFLNLSEWWENSTPSDMFEIDQGYINWTVVRNGHAPLSILGGGGGGDDRLWSISSAPVGGA